MAVMKHILRINPSNNFAENPWKYPGIFPGNPWKFPGIFHRKIRWKCRKLFRGISRNPFRGTRSEEFLLTHSEKILITLSKKFLVTNSREFLFTNSTENPEKMLTKFVEILGNFHRKVLQNQFLGISWNYSQDFLKSSWSMWCRDRCLAVSIWYDKQLILQIEFCSLSHNICCMHSIFKMYIMHR